MVDSLTERLVMGPEPVSELVERLKAVFRYYGYEPADLSVHADVRSRYRTEFGREPHEDAVAWFNFAAELRKPKDGDSPATRGHTRSPRGLIAPMMRPYTVDEAIEEADAGFAYLREDGPSKYEAPAYAFHTDGTADFVLLGSDETGFHYCLSPASNELGNPRIFMIGEASASFFLQVPGAFDESLSLTLHDDMPTLRLYLEALVRAYHRRQLMISDGWFTTSTYYPWPAMTISP